MLPRAFHSWGRMLGLGSSASDAAAQAFEEERRSWGRLPCEVATACRPAASASERGFDVRVRDVSCGGISMQAERSFHPGELLSLSLPQREVEEACEVLVCVVHCRAAHDSWHLGGTFATPLSADDLARFGGPRARPASPDQRLWIRFPCPAQASVKIVNSSDGAAERPCLVINVSANGIALRAPAPLNVGELLSIELRRGTGQPVVTTLATVVRSSVERDGERVVGCNFIHELTDEQLRLLL